MNEAKIIYIPLLELTKNKIKNNKKTFHVKCPFCGSDNSVKMDERYIFDSFKTQYESDQKCWNCKMYFCVKIKNGKVKGEKQ